MRLAFWLALSACLPSIGLEIPPRDDTRSLALIIFESDRPIALIGLAPGETIPVSIEEEARLYLLAFDRPLEAIGIQHGVVLLSPMDESGRPLPVPRAWATGTIRGFGGWSEEPTPAELDGVRIADLDLSACWREGGCARLDPPRCEAPCSTSAPLEPARPDRDPDPPAPAAAPIPPAWMPESLSECDPGEAQFYGESGCAPIGAPCPAAGFADDVPPGAIYVDPSRAVDGDGSSASPRNRLPAQLPSGTILALAAGDFDLAAHSPLDGVAIYGACVAGTSLAGVILADGSELHGLRLADGASIAGSDVVLDRVESFGTLRVDGAVSANDLAVRSATVGVDSTGTFSVNRFYAKSVGRTAIYSRGTLAVIDAVIDGVGHAPTLTGAITSIGPADVRRAHIEDGQRFGMFLSTGPNSGRHRVEDVAVRRVQGAPTDPNDPYDLARAGIWFVGKGRLERAVVERGFERGVLFSSSSATIADIRISDLAVGPTGFSEGFDAVTSTNTTISRVSVGDTFGSGFVTVGRSDIEVFDLSARAEQGGTYGVFVVGSQARIERADLGGFQINAITLADSHLVLVDARIREVGGYGVIVTSSLAPTALEVRRAVLEDVGNTGIRAGAPGPAVSIALSEVKMQRVTTGLYSEGEKVTIGIDHERFEDGVVVGAVRGGSASWSDSSVARTFTGILVNEAGLGGDPLPTMLTMERIDFVDQMETAVRLDRAVITARLTDVSMTGSQQTIECKGQLGDPTQLQLTIERLRIEQIGGEVNWVGMDLESCRVDAVDLAIVDVKGVGAAISDSDVHLRRFLFQGNQTAIRTDSDLFLEDGSFRRNRTALNLEGRPPSADQLVGVSFVDNGADLD